MRVKFKTLAVSLIVFLSFLGGGYRVFAYSGLLDSYAATNVSNVGIYEYDSFTTYGHVNVEHNNTNFQAHAGGTILSLMKHGAGGYSAVGTNHKASGYGTSNLRFDLPSKATYKLFFHSSENYNKVNFKGNVWDY